MIHATEAKVAAELGIDGIAHLATPEMLERYERVNAALLADREPKTVEYKSCKRCYGKGTISKSIDIVGGTFDWMACDCPDCNGTGSVVTP